MQPFIQPNIASFFLISMNTFYGNVMEDMHKLKAAEREDFFTRGWK